MKRFSRPGLMDDISTLLSALETRYGFVQSNGSNQVTGKGEEILIAYGEYKALSDLWEKVEDGSIGSGEIE